MKCRIKELSRSRATVEFTWRPWWKPWEQRAKTVHYRSDVGVEWYEEDGTVAPFWVGDILYEANKAKRVWR